MGFPESVPGEGLPVGGDSAIQAFSLLQKGKKTKKLLTDNGLVTLNRIRELEGRGFQIREAMKEVKEEIGEGDDLEKGKGKPNQSYSIPKRELPQTVERYIDFSEDQVQEKDDQIENLQARLEKSMEITEKRIKGETQSERCWKFLKKTYNEIERTDPGVDYFL